MHEGLSGLTHTIDVCPSINDRRQVIKNGAHSCSNMERGIPKSVSPVGLHAGPVFGKRVSAISFISYHSMRYLGPSLPVEYSAFLAAAFAPFRG